MKNMIAVIFCLLIWLIPYTGNATPFDIENGQIYGHQSPDETISFFIQDAANTNWNFQVHNVLSVDGKQYYFLYAELNDKRISKEPVTGVVLTLDGKDFALQQLEGIAPIVNDRMFRGWYALPEEVITKLGHVEQMALNFQFASSPPKVCKPFPSITTSFRKIVTMTRQQYVREGKVLEAADDLKKVAYYPQIYIPDTTQEEVLAALIYDANFYKSKNKDKFDYSNGYFVKYTLDPRVTQFESRQSYGENYAFITVVTKPYKDGVWATLNLQRKEYGGNRILYYPINTPTSGVISSRSYWRSESEQWAARLASAYKGIYGYYDCGLTWTEAKDKKQGPFPITNVNAATFPELADIKNGDLITKINNTPTESMTTLDLEYWTQSDHNPITFTIKSPTGVEKKITVVPQLQLMKAEDKKDYKKLIEKMPKWFTKTDKRAPLTSGFVESDIYNPLGEGLK
jgi:hypothetical protein